VAHVVRQVDGGHAALAHLPLQAVAVGEGGRQMLERLGQGCLSVWLVGDVGTTSTLPGARYGRTIRLM
jgi:hypothetical protein